MSTQPKALLLDMNESEAARGLLLRYTEEKKEAHAKSLGLIHKPKPPGNGLIGALMLYLQNLPMAAPNELTRVTWESSSFESWMGMHWLIKKEWNNSYKFPSLLKGIPGIAQAKRDAEPMGDVLKAILHLCEKSGTIARLHGYPESIGGIKLFSVIAMELAHYGGVLNLLGHVYPEKKYSGNSKKEWCRECSSIVTALKSFQAPSDTFLLFGQLLKDAAKSAEQVDEYKRTVFADLITALRAYIKHTDSKQCGLVTLPDGQTWAISIGRGTASRKLVSRSLGP